MLLSNVSPDEDKRLTRLCEVQDGSSSVSVCGLSLAASPLSPLLRALKLQASLTELRLSGNRLSDGLVPELVATTITMPRLRLLDVSANCITGEGLEKAVDALKGLSHPAFPVNQLLGNKNTSAKCRKRTVPRKMFTPLVCYIPTTSLVVKHRDKEVHICESTRK